MEPADLQQTFNRVESQLAAHPEAGLAGTGFWSAVATVKQDPELVAQFAPQIAAIDREGLRRWALLTLPIGGGTAAAIAVTLVGFFMAGAAYYAADPWNGFLMLLGMGVVQVATHGLAHLVVGRAVGIRFTDWFVGTLKRPQPGVKIDYTSYLQASPTRRAWMHASGAIVSKIVPFAFIPAAVAADTPGWTIPLLVIVGVGGIITDLLWSTKTSDWKKVRREMALRHSPR